MDPLTIATGVLTVLTPFLVEGGKAVAKKAGEALWAALEERFKGNPVAEEALVDVKAKPQDEDNQAALRKEIRKLAEADVAFKAELEKLLAAAEAEAPGSVYIEVRDGAAAVGDHATALGAGAVQVGGSVGGDVVTGNKTAAPIFDQRGQTVGTQTNIAGDVHGPVLSGDFDGPVAVGGGEAVNLRGSQGAVYKPTGTVKQHFGDDIRITGDGNVVGNNNRVNVDKSQTTSVTLEDFLRLLGELQRQLPQAGLDPDVADAVAADLQVTATQARKPKPNAGLILSRLVGVAELLATADGVAGMVQRLQPLAQRALEAAQQLFR